MKKSKTLLVLGIISIIAGMILPMLTGILLQNIKNDFRTYLLFGSQFLNLFIPAGIVLIIIYATKSDKGSEPKSKLLVGSIIARVISMIVTIGNLGVWLSARKLLDGHTVGQGFSSYQGIYAEEAREIDFLMIFSVVLCAMIGICIFVSIKMSKKGEIRNIGNEKSFELSNNITIVCFVISMLLLALNSISYFQYH